MQSQSLKIIRFLSLKQGNMCSPASVVPCRPLEIGIESEDINLIILVIVEDVFRYDERQTCIKLSDSHSAISRHIPRNTALNPGRLKKTMEDNLHSS